MGVVYQAHDVERGMDVALKVLLRMNADGIYRLKSEFRSLADVSHPNLVGLFELVSEGEQWFIAMELVEGVDLLTWLRQELDGAIHLDDDTLAAANGLASERVEASITVAMDEAAELSSASAGSLHATRSRRLPHLDRLRDAMRQLALAVHAIHVSGKLHRDIKPSNAMVTADGRLVMLDFGLVQEDSSLPHLRDRRDAQPDVAISGTPSYMAPEQATGRAITTASDWYAVGVLLYQALTGDLPHQGSWHELLQAKLHAVPVPPHLLLSGVPRDLSDLTMALLQADPAKRPREADILRTLGARLHQDSGLTSSDAAEPPLMGREEELQLLHTHWTAVQRERRPHLVHVSGPAGMGKSAILDTFMDELRKQADDGIAPLLLNGRCHERESVPYKAFDAVIDTLTRHLLQLSNSELTALITPDVAALAQIFPVLRRVTAIDMMPLQPLELEDRRGLRRRAALGLKRLLGRLAVVQPLLVVMDNLQWGDLDSAELLASLVERPDPLPALLLLAWRDEDADRSPVLQAIARLGTLEPSDVTRARMHVGPLATEFAESLAMALLPQDGVETRPSARIVAKEAGGNPLFIMELAHFRQSDIAADGTQTAREVTLDEVLQARIENLPTLARHLLEVVAVAGKPLGQKQVFMAAALGREEPAAIARLRNGHYVRTVGVGDGAHIETFHNRIREAAMALMSPTRLQTLHAALLRALTMLPTAGGQDVEALADHALGAGDATVGMQYSLVAARRAHSVFANHDAVRRFETVMRLLAARTDSASVALRLEVAEEAAEAARQAGLYEFAHQLLLERLAAEKSPTKQAELHVNLGRIAQERGDTAAALVQLETALRMFGKTPPGTLCQLALEAVGQFSQHLFRAWTPQFVRNAKDDPSIQQRADTMFALIRIYYFIDVAKVPARQVPRASRDN